MSEEPSISRPVTRRLFAEHPRQWRDFHYVYAVISRRSKGLSIGVNLNPDKACNFDCVYCCVNRTPRGLSPSASSSMRTGTDPLLSPRPTTVHLGVLGFELDHMLTLATRDELWRHEPFSATPAELRRINDIAFSGDGEPTSYRLFDQAVALAAQLKAAHQLPAVKIILVTNATLFHRPAVQRGLALLDQHQGEIWAKLDAGTEDYYRLINRTSVPLSRVLGNLRDCGRVRPIVLQSLFLSYRGQGPSEAEFDAYLDRVAELVEQGCRIKLVQLYTVARRTAQRDAAPLTNAELDALAARFRARLPGVPMEPYYGVNG